MANFTNNIMKRTDQKSLKSKIGRNDPCPCGSGKKYKKCCLDNDNKFLLNHFLIKDKFEVIDKSNRQLNGNMDTVNFINCEESDDLIVSFSFDEGTEFGIEGFMIHRCMKYEFILKPWERGPSVDWTIDDEIILVKSVIINPQRMEIETTIAKYQFDLTKISNEDYQAAVRVLLKMNFDGIYNLEIE